MDLIIARAPTDMDEAFWADIAFYCISQMPLSLPLHPARSGAVKIDALQSMVCSQANKEQPISASRLSYLIKHKEQIEFKQMLHAELLQMYFENDD